MLTCFPASAPCIYVIFQFIEELSLNWSILFDTLYHRATKKIGNNPLLASSLYHCADWSPKIGSRCFWFCYKIGLPKVLIHFIIKQQIQQKNWNNPLLLASSFLLLCWLVSPKTGFPASWSSLQFSRWHFRFLDSSDCVKLPHVIWLTTSKTESSMLVELIKLLF